MLILKAFIVFIVIAILIGFGRSRRGRRRRYCCSCISASTTVKDTITVVIFVIVNRVSDLINTKLRNENYRKANFGTHATQVIMDAVDSSKRRCRI